MTDIVAQHAALDLAVILPVLAQFQLRLTIDYSNSMGMVGVTYYGENVTSVSGDLDTVMRHIREGVLAYAAARQAPSSTTR